MKKVVRLNIGGHVYEVGPNTAKTTIATALEAYNGRNAIVALEKENADYTFVEMRKDVFPSATMLKEAVRNWKRQGFKAHFTREERRNNANQSG